MKKNIKYFMMAAVALLSMSACNNEMDEQDPANNGKLQPVQFQMSFASTRTTTGDETAGRATTWKAGDAIGIFAYPAGSTTNAVATNFKYILGNDGNWTATGSEIYPDQALDYYAYYPYQDGITDPAAINVAALTDQSKTDESSYAASDILASKTSNVAAGNGKVTLAFSHMFAMVEVKVQGDLITQKPTKVELLGVKLNAELNLTATTPVATQKADATAQDVTMFCLENPNADSKVYSFRAAVPAQEIAASTPLVRIYAPDAASKTYTMQHTAAVSYNAGQFRQMIVNIGSKRVVLIIPAGDTSINPWTPSDAINGDGSPLATQLITEEISDLTLGEMSTVTSDAALASSFIGWYACFNGSNTTFSVVNETIENTETKAIKMIWDGSLSWYQAYIGYYNYNVDNILENKTYELTYWAKADEASSSNKAQLGTYFKLTKEAFTENENNKMGMFAYIPKADQEEGVIKNAAWESKNLTTTWTKYSIKFKMSSFYGSSGPGAIPNTSRAWNDLTSNPKSYMIGFAPRTFKTSYYIADVKLQEVQN